MEKIPDEVRKQIEEAALKEEIYPKKYGIGSREGYDTMMKYEINSERSECFEKGAEFGYSLASKALTDANNHLKELRKEHKQLYDEYTSVNVKLSDANKEIERRGELLVHWWKVANRIKEGSAKLVLDEDEFLEYQNAIEKKVQQFKTENNL